MQAPLFVLLSLVAAGDTSTLDLYGAPPAGSVRIVRDRFGTPHIIARDNKSLFYGVGYAQAEDQLENLVTNLLRGEGRAAEREGASEVQTDHLARALKVPQRAREQYAGADAEIKEQLDAYSAGVNAYIDEHRATIPKWIEHIQPHQILSFSMYIDTMFSAGHCRADLQKAGVRLSALDNLPDSVSETFGSNQFAVGPERSATGSCILSMDPHLRHTGFYRWYEMHMVGPDINAFGACFFGSPYVSMGRTEGTAWCMTVNGPDLGDVFAFQINPDNPAQYKGLDGWQNFEAWDETHKVAMPDGTTEQTIPVKATDVGPVVAARDSVAYVFALPTADDAIRARQSYDVLRAKNSTEFRGALKNLGLVMFNILYADRRGDVFYISNGRVPKRDVRIGTDEIRPGHEAWARWQGIHTQAELPQVLNPPQAYVFNTNSGCFNVTPEGAPKEEDFPKYMNNHRPNSRWRRLSELLAADESISFEEMIAYAADTKVEKSEEYVGRIAPALRGAEGENAELLTEIADVLEAWDKRTDLQSKGAVLYFALMSDDDFVKAVREEDVEAGRAAAAKVAQAVKEKFGSLDVPWQEFSRIKRGDVEMGVAGTGPSRTRSRVSVIQPALRPTYGELQDGRRMCTGGSSYGMIVDFSGKTRAVSCLPFGVSEHADSSHFADQLPLYAQGRFKPVWFWADEMSANIESEKTLKTH